MSSYQPIFFLSWGEDQHPQEPNVANYLDYMAPHTEKRVGFKGLNSFTVSGAQYSALTFALVSY